MSSYICCHLILSQCASPIPNSCLLFLNAQVQHSYFLCAPAEHPWSSVYWFTHFSLTAGLFCLKCQIISQPPFFQVQLKYISNFISTQDFIYSASLVSCPNSLHPDCMSVCPVLTCDCPIFVSCLHSQDISK